MPSTFSASLYGGMPRHRRRRMVALMVIAGALSLIAGAITGAGGRTTAAPHLVRGTGFLGRIRQLAGDGAGSFTGAERQAENIAINRTLSYTPYVRIAGGQHREIALTFDDGPGPYTPQVLSILERNKVP